MKLKSLHPLKSLVSAKSEFVAPPRAAESVLVLLRAVVDVVGPELLCFAPVFERNSNPILLQFFRDWSRFFNVGSAGNPKLEQIRRRGKPPFMAELKFQTQKSKLSPLSTTMKKKKKKPPKR